MNLSQRHKTLLRKMVEVVDRGCSSEFAFMPSGLGNILMYEGHPNVTVDADESDLQELAARWLITLERNHLNILHGKPTELGLRLAHSNFAAGAAKDGAGLLRNQLDKMRAIEELPRDSAEAKLWERNTESVLRNLRGDDKAFEFRQLGQTGEFSPMAEVLADEVDGEETLTRRLREMQKTLIEGELFELEELSPLEPRPEAGTGDDLLPASLLEGTTPYIERVGRQVNACYRHECYDACAVMARRLVETLIVEAYERRGIASKIKNQSGDFFNLGKLVPLAISEPSWNLGRSAKRALPRLKDFGDLSAHDRRFNAQKHDVDKVAADLRTVVQEFLSIAGLK